MADTEILLRSLVYGFSSVGTRHLEEAEELPDEYPESRTKEDDNA